MRARVGALGARDTPAWIAWVRLLAVPFVVIEVLVERGNYPAGYERWAWIATAALALAAVVFFRQRETALPALAFDLALVSGFVLIYSFELGTPVRQLLFLPVVEAALRYGARGALGGSLATVPALVLFEWRQAVVLDLYPFDAGHVLGPLGLEILVGLCVGLLASRAAGAAGHY